MVTSYNGWFASESPSDFGGLDNRVVPGSDPAMRLRPGVRAGDVATVLFWLAWQLDMHVEPIETFAAGDDWGFSFRKNRNANNYSCHASGTAFDFNATLHPNGKRGTWSADKKAKVRGLLAELEGCVRWGEDFTGTIDGMHFEIVKNAAEVRRVANKIIAKYGTIESWTGGAGNPTTPAPTPVPPNTTPQFREIAMGGVTELNTKGEQVRRDQADLIDTGFAVGRVGADGFAGDATVTAIRNFQFASRILTVDGKMGDDTRSAIHRVPSWSRADYRAFQQRLKDRGWKIVVDGDFGAKSKATLKSFQAEKGLTPDGLPGPQSWTALWLAPR